MTPLKAPFPAFGGKSQVADLVWARLGNPRNYIEPFAFSAAILLRRPVVGAIETINDLNAYVSNFWRAVQADPEAVARHADWPVNETDLHARHRWLVQSATANAELQRVREDPEHFDAKIAGWWCWGACSWIGSGWCENPEWEGRSGIGQRNDRGVCQPSGSDPWQTRPTMRPNQSVNALDQKRPVISADGSAYGLGVNGQMKSTGEKVPTLERVVGGGKGVNGIGTYDTHRPAITDEFTRGRGVNSNDSLGTCETRRRWLTDWMQRLQDRLRPVRVCCGHWARVCDSDSTLTRLGTTGVFLDPPYRKHLADGTKNRSSHIYANDKTQDVGALCDEVSAWCLKWGGDREIRFALCGLEGEYPAIDAAGWEKVPWKSRGGYGNRTEEGKANAARERIWFSPGCLQPEAVGLFGTHKES
jgi:site-specific DNA-adenine methylase